MLTGFADGELILEERARRSGRRLRGRFPYNSTAVLSDGGRTGRPRKERFAPRAFAYNVEKEDVDIRLLVGHDFGKPLASREAGTLVLKDGEDALTFTATIPAEMEEASYVRDFLAGHSAGLVRGISPGFRIPPRRTVPDAERVDEEDPAEGRALIRTIMQALLFELSVVTSAAYPNAEVEARNWTPEGASFSRPNVTQKVLRGWLL